MARYILTDNYDEDKARVLVFKSKDALIDHLIYNVIGYMELEVRN